MKGLPAGEALISSAVLVSGQPSEGQVSLTITVSQLAALVAIENQYFSGFEPPDFVVLDDLDATTVDEDGQNVIAALQLENPVGVSGLLVQNRFFGGGLRRNGVGDCTRGLRR